MSLEELRDNNKRLVTEKALECFIRGGIDSTAISDIARAAGLTERSIYRYYPSKVELVMAASFLYWDKALEQAAGYLREHSHPGMTGIEEIAVVLNGYSQLVFSDPDGIRFSLDAELALYRAGLHSKVINRPPERFESSNGPMAAAIRHGLADGSVSPEKDLKMLYYNSYDTLLGVIERMTVDVTSVGEVDGRARLSSLCDMFTREFAAK